MTNPELSLIVVSFNMARELPRTIRTLSSSMQLEISPDEYELIVVENGSTQPFPEAECRRWVPDLILHRMERASASPVAAVNRGLEIARGELVAVLIDGARMASPRLLRTALEASRFYDRPVIGTLAFHLGPEMQMQSLRSGYDQNAEDELLRSSGWEEDGYRLFEISVLAGSSAKG
jgi:glycosyltransferase involved in cell wall biosynthesis